MCQEYISSSRPAILGMANRLSGTGVNIQVEPRIDDTDEEVTFGGRGVTGLQDLSQTQFQQEDDLDVVMEEDEEMYQKAGIPFPTQTGQQGNVEASIKQTLSAIPAANGANINLKVIVINNMSGNINL